MTAKLTSATVAKAKAAPGKDRSFIWDNALPGFGLMVTASGHKSFVFQYRTGAQSRRMKLAGGFLRYEASRDSKKAVDSVSRSGAFTLADARKEALAASGAVARGRDPLDEMRKAEAKASNTLKSIFDDYMGRDGARLRSAGERRRVFERYILPVLGAKQIDAIKRPDITKLLDRVEDENGPVQADHVLAVLRKLFNWYAARADDFNSPIVRGMAKTKPHERRRQRTLADDELRAVWKTAEQGQGPFPALVRFLLLTATRRDEGGNIRRQERDGDTWIIPGTRHKSKKDFLLPLSPQAAKLLDAMPTIGKKGFVFTNDGKTPISGWSKYKAAFDTACGVTGWTLHDLRRTARSLMSRGGVDPDHAERALGHVIPGIRGTYDRFAFHDEKKAAFVTLAAQLDRLTNPLPNVVPLGRQKGQQGSERVL